MGKSCFHAYTWPPPLFSRYTTPSFLPRHLSSFQAFSGPPHSKITLPCPLHFSRYTISSLPPPLIQFSGFRSTMVPMKFHFLNWAKLNTRWTFLEVHCIKKTFISDKQTASVTKLQQWTLCYRAIVKFSLIDTFKVYRYHTRWNIQTLIDQVRMLHSIPVWKSDW